jgi:hypothetical protein
MKHPPIPPENVRIVRPDGREIPLEVRYIKTYTADDGKPMHEWEAISEYVPQIPQDKLTVGTLPPRTEIGITMRAPRRPDGS